MAQKTDFNISGMLAGFDKNVKKDKKKGRAEVSTDSGTDKSKGSMWRKTERPFRKTIHCDENIHTLINFVANIYNKKVDDVLYECIEDGLHRMYGKSIEEILAKKSQN